MRSYVAVKLYGPGIVAHNYIANFHDGINIETYGNPDGSTPSGPDIPDGPKYPTRDYWDRRPVAIDFYGNYITNSHDNPIEADGGMHNIRIMNNMLINHPSHAFCNQPALGGPVYWIRTLPITCPAAQPASQPALRVWCFTTTPFFQKRLSQAPRMLTGETIFFG